MSNRIGTIKRKTNETSIDLSLNLDGNGSSSIKTGIGFFDHMLTLFSNHGLFTIDLIVKGDLDVDFHHTVEDTGICLGQAIKQALGDAHGINRYASAAIPMDETLCQLALDISNRPHLDFNIPECNAKVGDFDTELTEEFFKSLSLHAGLSLHIDVIRGKNSHHIIESIFKAFGIVLDKAIQIDDRKTGVPSTKGIL